MTNLSPCPFCGHSASIERYGDRSQSTIYQCDNCSCSLETGEEFNHGTDWNRRAPIDAAAISAYLSSIGGVVCSKEPVEHQRLVPGFGWQRVNDEDLGHYSAKGMPRRTLHTPIEAGNGDGAHVEALLKEIEVLRGDLDACQKQAIEDGNTISSLRAWQQGALSCREAEEARIEEYRIKAEGADTWLPIDRADKSIDRILDFPGMPRPIGNSEEYWVRDADGRIYQATWADDGKRAYWWDLEGESPVDPVEFMPHPLDKRFSPPPSVSSSDGRGE
ncbi:Lar family restriction alleviation protein [Rhizobium sp.]|uniref:Lar family restriction alleviation protein n=1 Tax=Rhizobium sp. TaxID=391 RepID=UPI003F808AE1